MRLGLLLSLLALSLAAETREAATNIRYDDEKGTLRWDVYGVVRDGETWRAGKKLLSCEIRFQPPVMKCGRRAYGFTVAEAGVVQGKLSYLLGHYIAESMPWFYRGGKSVPPGPDAPLRSALERLR